MSRKRPAAAPPPASARDEGLDDTLRDSFPASDPPSTIPDPAPEGVAEVTPGDARPPRPRTRRPADAGTG